MAETSDAAFLFADIAGFTALTEAHGDEHALAVVDEFARGVQAELPAVEGEFVKTVGDALMLRVPDPGKAILLGLQIAHDLIGAHGTPAVRVGVNYGPAVKRDGDYFGATINLAARVAALASGGEALVTGHTAALAPELGGVFYESRGPQMLRNVSEPQEIFAVFRMTESEEHFAIDPVCRMVVDPSRAVGRLLYDSTAYFFCSLTCAGQFAAQPDQFAGDRAH